MIIPEEADIDRELSRRSFYEFARLAWPVLEPETELKTGLSFGAICEHLQALRTGQIKKLIINVPPGCTKSILSCVMFPAWIWTDEPHIRFLTGSHSQTYSTRDALKTRRLITSEWYQQRWGHIFKLTGDQNQKTRYENDKTGHRAAITVRMGTGDKGDILGLDDPLNAHSAYSDAERNAVNEWMRDTWQTRFNDPANAREFIIMQRLHEQDPTGFVLAEFGGYEHLVLPMRFEADRRCKTSIFTDPRKKDGQLLDPDRLNAETVKSLEKVLGSHNAAGQLQQRPAPREGSIIKKAWLQYYTTLPKLDTVIQAWDLTFKGGAKNDYVVGGVFGKAGANVYLIDLLKDKMDVADQMKAITSMSEKHPIAISKYIEEAANGAAVITLLKSKVPGLIPVRPAELGGDKAARLGSIAPMIESGNFYLPANAPWLDDYVAEITAFCGEGSTPHDDQVDVTSMALIKLLLVENPWDELLKLDL